MAKNIPLIPNDLIEPVKVSTKAGECHTDTIIELMEDYLSFNNLFNSAVDKIQFSMEIYKKNEYQHAISLLWAGILLLLKSKLYSIHPILIVSDIYKLISVDFNYKLTEKSVLKLRETKTFQSEELDRISSNLFKEFESFDDLSAYYEITRHNQLANLEKYVVKERSKFQIVEPGEQFDFPTVSYEQILERFKHFGVDRSIINRYKTELGELKRTRNSIEHYFASHENETLKKTYEKSILFIQDYIEIELNQPSEDLFRNWNDFLEIPDIENNRQSIVNRYIDYEQHSSRSISKGVDPKYESLCTACGSPTIERDDILYCKNCGNEDEFDVCCCCDDAIPNNDMSRSFFIEREMCSDCVDYYIHKEK